MQLRHISPRSIDWVDAMDEGGGGRGWEKLGPEERTKLRHQVQYRGRNVDGLDEGLEARGRLAAARGQGFEPRSPSR
jgi:hypothetical protein